MAKGGRNNNMHTKWFIQFRSRYFNLLKSKSAKDISDDDLAIINDTFRVSSSRDCTTDELLDFYNKFYDNPAVNTTTEELEAFYDKEIILKDAKDIDRDKLEYLYDTKAKGKTARGFTEKELRDFFDKLKDIPCREHGLENKDCFQDIVLNEFKDKFIRCVMLNLNSNVVWMSKSALKFCKTSQGAKSNINAVYCETCGTRDVKQFAKKGKAGIGKIKCKLCRAIELKQGGIKNYSLYAHHLHLCNLTEEDVKHHEDELEKHTTRPSTNFYVDPYELSDGEVY